MMLQGGTEIFLALTKQDLESGVLAKHEEILLLPGKADTPPFHHPEGNNYFQG